MRPEYITLTSKVCMDRINFVAVGGSPFRIGRLDFSFYSHGVSGEVSQKFLRAKENYCRRERGTRFRQHIVSTLAPRWHARIKDTITVQLSCGASFSLCSSSGTWVSRHNYPPDSHQLTVRPGLACRLMHVHISWMKAEPGPGASPCLSHRASVAAPRAQCP